MLLHLTRSLWLLPLAIAHENFQDLPVTQAPDLRRRQAEGAAVCEDVASLISICDDPNPGSQALCLCYDNNTLFDPDLFDDAIDTCVNYASTALPASDLDFIESYQGFCTAIGDVVNGPSSASATTTPNLSGIASSVSSLSSGVSSFAAAASTASTTASGSRTSSSASLGSSSVDIFVNPACSTVGFALDYCNSVTPGFSTLDPTYQAPCLCYSSTVWSPNGFDDPVSSCVNYVFTADPAEYTDIAVLEGYCNSIGDVLTEGTVLQSGAASSTGGGIGIGGGGGGVGITLGATPARTTSRVVQSATSPMTTNMVASTPAQAPTPVLSTKSSGAGQFSSSCSICWLAIGLVLAFCW